MTIKYSPDEHGEVQAAAKRAGMATSAWVGMTSTGAARHELITLTQYQSELVRELIRVGWLLGKAGVNLNQSVAKLNATGQASPKLAAEAEYLVRLAERVEVAIAHIRSRM
jgi:hypothetical protein